MTELKSGVKNEKKTTSARNSLKYILPLAAGLAIGGYAYQKATSPETPKVININHARISHAPECNEVSNEAFSGMLAKGAAVHVGGMNFQYQGTMDRSAKLDISCPENGSHIISAGIAAPTKEDSIIEIPKYGVELHIRVHASDTERAIVSIVVQPSES